MTKKPGKNPWLPPVPEEKAEVNITTTNTPSKATEKRIQVILPAKEFERFKAFCYRVEVQRTMSDIILEGMNLVLAHYAEPPLKGE